ncbi:hypothetical protein A9Q84_04955 [Halobacteriovorax marinus]|uniref:Integral membrane protein n=1 Tax=Halobacteriovorax marinus TaxID=97084 RepID=A0A1Y5FEY7_9BACT|nr:hypothetical protein A9Q84_04955 [Halobacteriovorax marinus]
MYKEIKQIKNIIDVLLLKDEFLYLLSVFYFLLFSWPFVAIENMEYPVAIVVYLFFTWFSCIVILFYISRLRKKFKKN